MGFSSFWVLVGDRLLGESMYWGEIPWGGGLIRFGECEILDWNIAGKNDNSVFLEKDFVRKKTAHE